MPNVYSSGSSSPPASGSPKMASPDIPSPRGGVLSALWVQPDLVSFATQESGEKVILLIRQHPITNIPWLVAVVVMLFAPLILQYFPILNFLPMRFQLMGLLFWYLLTLAAFFEGFLNWFYNIFIITDLQVVDVDFLNLIYKQVNAAHLSKVQSVSFDQGGLLESLFDYGDVLIQTAAEIENIYFMHVPHPAIVAKTIDALLPEGDSGV
jgi:hypothetical protein